MLVPLALPLLEDFILLFMTSLQWASLQSGPEYFFEWITYYGEALLFEMVLYAATAGVALACGLSRKPGRIAMVGFGCVAALGAIAIFARQGPFGATNEYDSGQAWYLSSFLRFAAMLASATVFVVSCDRSDLTPPLAMRGGASARHGGTAQGAADADTPSKKPDALDELRKLKVLLDAGAITTEKYDKNRGSFWRKHSLIGAAATPRYRAEHRTRRHCTFRRRADDSPRAAHLEARRISARQPLVFQGGT